MLKEPPPVIARQQVRLLQQVQTFIGQRQRTAQQKRSRRVGRKDDGDEREDGIVDEGSGIDRYFVEAKDEGERRRHHGMQAEEGRKGYEDTDGESKRRALRRIINREQTAKCSA